MTGEAGMTGGKEGMTGGKEGMAGMCGPDLGQGFNARNHNLQSLQFIITL